ncbi:MAG: histone deacetylase [Myxococcota bacterium]|nr:histone deacetylase [Myxococcota bacterium]
MIEKPLVKAYYTDNFVLPLPKEHKFPMEKYLRLRQALLAQRILPDHQFFIPQAASDEDLQKVHTHDYVQRVIHGTLTPREMRRIGFPWSPEMVERSRRSVGATIEAATTAIEDGLSINLAGGTHHAFADRGEGFCVFNDVMVAAKVIQAKFAIKNILIIDLDVHQGNGTAELTQGDDSIFSFSIHGNDNFPYHKEESDLDFPLPSNTTDEPYLQALEESLAIIESRFQMDFVFYLAGADPYEYDQFGHLKLSKNGLRKRDEKVFNWCFARQLPLALTMSGGYAKSIDDIVEIHKTTIQVAIEEHRRTFTQRKQSVA